MKILPLTDENVLFELEQKNFADFYSLLGCKEEILNPFKHYVVAVLDDKIIGYAGVLMIENQAELLRIAVNPEHRKKGIGSLLLKYFLKFLKNNAISEFFLEVSEKNTTAINFYYSFNFKHIHTRKDYYGENNSALILKRRV